MFILSKQLFMDFKKRVFMLKLFLTMKLNLKFQIYFD